MRGFLLGKFLPPHMGHVFLCDFASAYVDELTILVCSLDSEPISGSLRYAWMREMFPRARVLHLAEDVPQEPSKHPQFWNIWRKILRRLHPEPIDFVFASEAYGHRLAMEVGARFVPVDPARAAVPVSGTAIRKAPFAHWEHIPRPVRPYFVKDVVIFGPESTGKSTLARQISAHFGTIFVPEYARTYTEAFGTNLGAEDLMRIACGHLASRYAAARNANRILIQDTDPVLTAVWSEMLVGSRAPWFDTFRETADLYLLTDVDAPWVDDGTRYFPDGRQRRRFLDLCRVELEQRRLPFVTLSGQWNERFMTAVRAIRERFPDLPSDTA
jgi:HTH-type transcriptional repressor of NAD biosynthesis genes